MKELPLKDIPNTGGFEFIGVTLDGKEIPCHVVDNRGTFYVSDDEGNSCFRHLRCWKRLPKTTRDTQP